MPSKSKENGGNKKQTQSSRAGIHFPVGRILKYLKKGQYASRIRKDAAVYMAAALEYLVAEVMELAGEAAKENKRTRITPRHITLAVRNDEELNELWKGVIISEGGVLPHIHQVLLPQKTPSDKRRR